MRYAVNTFPRLPRRRDVGTDRDACSIPPPASEARGGEGGAAYQRRVGGSLFYRSASEAPPTPDPSPPFAARLGGGEPRGRNGTLSMAAQAMPGLERRLKA